MDLVAFGFVVYHYLRVYLLGRRALSFISIESIKSPDFVSFYIAFDIVIVDIARDWPMRSLSRDSLELHLPSKDARVNKAHCTPFQGPPSDQIESHNPTMPHYLYNTK